LASGHAGSTAVLYCGSSSYSSTSAVYPLGIETECEQGGAGTYNLQFCPATTQGETCGGSGPAWEQVTVSSGGGTVNPDPSLTATLGACTGTGTMARCSLSVTQTGAYSQSDLYAIQQQGTTAQAGQYANNSSVMSSTMGTGVVASNGQQIVSGKNTNAGGYTGELVADGGGISTCFAGQQSQIAGGKTVYSCSGNTSVSVNGACNQSQSCVKWLTSTQTSTQTCAQTVNATSTTCTTQTPTETCTLSNQQLTENCAVQTTPQVSVSQSCTPGATIASWTGWAGTGNSGNQCTVSVACALNAQALTFTYSCYGDSGELPAGSGYNNVGQAVLSITPYAATDTGPDVPGFYDNLNYGFWYGDFDGDNDYDPGCPSITAANQGYEAPSTSQVPVGGQCLAGQNLGTVDPSWNFITWVFPVFYLDGGCNTSTNQCSYTFDFNAVINLEYYGGYTGTDMTSDPVTLTFTYPHRIATITGNGVNDGCTPYGG
jgi:hypothetical protein